MKMTKETAKISKRIKMKIKDIRRGK